MFSASVAKFVIVAAVSIPAGWLASVMAGRESGRPGPSSIAVIGLSIAIGIWAALVIPGTWWLLAATLALGWTLLTLGIVDLVAFRLPDVLTLPLVAGGVLLSLRLPDHDPLAHLIGAATGFLVLYLIAILYRRARAREGLGLGDAKLAAAAGAWLSWQALPSVILIACAAAFIWIGVRVALRGRAVLSQQIAFGVPLCFAFWLIWLYGAPL
jgi:leader peptidase (prepilin peptidase)/N-methyltransferase